MTDRILRAHTVLSAYYLIHRQSEDLDRFGSPGMDARDFRTFVEGHLLRNDLHVVSRGPANQGFSEFLISDRPVTAWNQTPQEPPAAEGPSSNPRR